MQGYAPNQSFSLFSSFMAGKEVSPVMTKIESLKRADEIDVSSEAADTVVTQPQVLEVCQRLEIIGDGLDSEPRQRKTEMRTVYAPETD